ncbi:hypothetical protein HK103_004208 [Boothiomyces macroporosus]|uniref:Uncharacterized protein n=1 Tax=Boothiomyces macroporosus TaxID=261099 RepID=A0AAD5Y489_9FUNG|nr:hypothetical protein HK103_004208 [Boothiomyces macroporosus]
MTVENVVGFYGEDHLVEKLITDLGTNSQIYLDNKYYSATLFLKKRQLGGAVIYVFDQEFNVNELQPFQDVSVKLCVGNNEQVQLQCLDFGFEYVEIENKERLIEALECNIWKEMQLKQNVDYELEMAEFDDTTVGSETVHGDFGDFQKATDLDEFMDTIDLNEVDAMRSMLQETSNNDGFESILNAIKDIKSSLFLIAGNADTKGLDERRKIAENVALAFSMAFPE